MSKIVSLFSQTCGVWWQWWIRIDSSWRTDTLLHPKRVQSWSWVIFFKTQPNPKFLDPTQPNPQKYPPDPTQPIIDTWYGYTGNFIQQVFHVTDKFTVDDSYQLQYSLTDSRVFYDVKNITQSNLHPTQPNPTHQKLKKTDPIQPNPTQPNPWMDPTHDQLWTCHKPCRSAIQSTHPVYLGDII